MNFSGTFFEMCILPCVLARSLALSLSLRLISILSFLLLPCSFFGSSQSRLPQFADPTGDGEELPTIFQVRIPPTLEDSHSVTSLSSLLPWK